MGRYHIRVVGGSCGNRMFVIIEHLAEMIARAGYDCRITHQSIWETRAVPPNVDLVLQLLPALTPDEVDCPLINIKPLLTDLEHAPTLASIFEVLKEALGGADSTTPTGGNPAAQPIGESRP